MTGGNVYDAKASVAETHQTVDEYPFVIRSTVTQYIAHFRQDSDVQLSR